MGMGVMTPAAPSPPPTAANLFAAASQGDTARVESELRAIIQAQASESGAAEGDAHAKDPFTAMTNGWMPVHAAAAKGHLGALRLLTEHYNARMGQGESQGTPLLALVTESGRSALHLAAERGHLNCLRYLVEMCGAPEEDGGGGSSGEGSGGGSCDVLLEKDASGNTALHLAAHRGHADVVRYVLRRSLACATVESEDGMTACHVAAAGGQVQVSE